MTILAARAIATAIPSQYKTPDTSSFSSVLTGFSTYLSMIFPKMIGSYKAKTWPMPASARASVIHQR